MSYTVIEDGLILGDIDSRKLVNTDDIINVSEFQMGNSHNFLLSLDADPEINHKNWRAALDKLIELRSAGQTVYIHCIEGVSRSASVVLAYFIIYHKMVLEEALEILKINRPSININRKYLQYCQQL